MAKTLSIDDRIELCGMYKGKIEKDISKDLPFLADYITFQETVISSYNFQQYDLPLYCYGLWNKEQYSFISSEKMKAIYKAQDENFYEWIRLCEQLKLLFERNKQGVRIYSTDGKGKEREQIKDSLHPNGGLNKVIIEHLSKDLIEFEKSFVNNRFEYNRNINLETLAERLEYAHIQNESYNANLKEAQMLITHSCIQQLAFLIRLDKALESNPIQLKIDEVKLTSIDFSFIYSFLEHFGILSYEYDINNTTSRSKIIRERFSNFPSLTNKKIAEMLQNQKNRINNILSVVNKANTNLPS